MKKLLLNIGKKSKKAFSTPINSTKKNRVLRDYVQLIEKNKNLIFKENLKDIKTANQKKLRENLVKRLYLNENKILEIINSIKKIIKLKDPTNNVFIRFQPYHLCELLQILKHNQVFFRFDLNDIL